MVKKLLQFILGLTLATMPLAAQSHKYPALDTNNLFTGQNTFQQLIVGNYTVAQLGSLSPQQYQVAFVTDLATTSSCSVGSGTNKGFCYYTGSGWQVISGGGGGGPSGTPGVSFSVNYPQSTEVQRIQAACNDAANLANGNTSGICSLIGDQETANWESMLTIGTSGGNYVELELPSTCNYTSSNSASQTAMIYQYGHTAIHGNGPRGGCRFTNGSGNNNLNYMLVTNGNYFRDSNFQLYNTTYTMAGNAVLQIDNAQDTSVFQDIEVQNYVSTSSAINITSGGVCCSVTLERVTGYGNNTSGPILTINGSGGSGIPYGVNIINSSFGHPAPNVNIIQCTDTSPGNIAVNFSGTYEETNSTDTTTPLNEANGCRIIRTVGQNVTATTSGTSSAPTWQLNGTQDISFEADGLAARNFVANSIAVQNKLSTTSVNGVACSSTPCNILYQSNGALPIYRTDTTTVDKATILAVAQTPTGVTIVPNGTNGGTGYTGTASVTLNGFTCSVAPVVSVYNAYGTLLYTITNPGTCTVIGTVTVNGTAGSGATLQLGLEGTSVTASTAGQLLPNLQTGAGLDVLQQQATLIQPNLQDAVLTIGTQRYPGLSILCSGAVQQFVYYTGSTMLFRAPCSSSDSVGFGANGLANASVLFGQNTPDGSTSTGWLQNVSTNPSYSAVTFNPEMSGTQANPINVGLDFVNGNTGGLLALSGGAIGSGYNTSGTGTCTVSGGTFISGTPATCTAVANGTGGVVLTLVPNSGIYSVVPTFSFSGLGSGTGAFMTAVISNPNSANGTYVSLPSGVQEIAAGTHKTPGTVYAAFGPSGVTVGNPTGGFEGAGSINIAGNCYINGVAGCGSGGGGGGTVTTFSAGNLSPLFTTSVATATSTPALSFALSNAAQNSIFAGPATGGAGAPSFQTAPTFSGANLSALPTNTALYPNLNQSTTGTAAGLTSYPTLCTGGQFSQGLSSGSNNCATPSGGGTIGGSATLGYVPFMVTNTTTIGTSHLDDGVTTASTITSSEPINVNSAGSSTVSVGTDNSAAGTLVLSNGSANAHTTYGSVATTSNEIDGPATVPTNLHAFYCAVSGVKCALTDTGYAYNAIPLTAFATVAANTTLANVTGSSAAPTAAAIPSGIQNYVAGTGYNQATAHQLVSGLLCADSSGSGTAQSCTTSPSFTPAAGDTIVYTTTTANTGTGLTINVNSAGAKSVAKWQGSTTLAANDMLAGKQVQLTYDGTNWEMGTIGNAPSGGSLPSSTNGQTYYSAAGTGAATSAIQVFGATAGSQVAIGGSSPVSQTEISGSIGYNALLYNTSFATTNGSCASGATSCTITNGTKLNAGGGYVVLGYQGGSSIEFACYSAATSTTITFGGGNCTGTGRGYWGSTASTFGSGSNIALVTTVATNTATTVPFWFYTQDGSFWFNPPNNGFPNTNNAGFNVDSSAAFSQGVNVGPSTASAKAINVGVAGFGVQTSTGNYVLVTATDATPLRTNTTQSITGTSLTAITAAQTPALPANSTAASTTHQGILESDCQIFWQQATAIATVQFGVKASAAPTGLYVIDQDWNGTTLATTNPVTITSTTATATSGSIAPTAFGATYFTKITLVMNPGTTNSPSVQLYGLTSNASDALTIEPGTGCTAWK